MLYKKIHQHHEMIFLLNQILIKLWVFNMVIMINLMIKDILKKKLELKQVILLLEKFLKFNRIKTIVIKFIKIVVQNINQVYLVLLIKSILVFTILIILRCIMLKLDLKEFRELVIKYVC